MRLSWILPLSLGLLGLPLGACGGGGNNTTGTGTGGGATTGTGTGGAGTGGAGTGGAASGCTMPTPVKCSDQIILAMNLQPDRAKGLITSTADGAGWTSNVDATAGGAFASKPDSYTYGKFTDQGLVKVDLADQDSLTSMAWDIAFRRYVIRINSADSGPSCVQGARVPGTQTYDQVTTEPATLDFHADDYFTDSCDLIPDGSGLPDSPATTLSSFWTYPGCVQMTDHVFVLQLADGRHVKLVVDDYYTPAVQDQCDSMGTIPMSNTGSGNVIIRWAFFQ